MAKELTAVALGKMKPGSTRQEIPDGRIAGLYFIIQPSGKRSWAVRYQVRRQAYQVNDRRLPGNRSQDSREKRERPRARSRQG